MWRFKKRNSDILNQDSNFNASMTMSWDSLDQLSFVFGTVSKRMNEICCILLLQSRRYSLMFIVMGARVAVASQLCKCQNFWCGKTHQQSWLATMWWKICRLRRGYIAVNCLMVEERNRDCSISAKSWCYKLQAITIDIGAWETGVFTRQNSKNQREHGIIRGAKTELKSVIHNCTLPRIFPCACSMNLNQFDI